MADEREVLVEVKNLEVTYGSGRKAYKAVIYAITLSIMTTATIP